MTGSRRTSGGGGFPVAAAYSECSPGGEAMHSLIALLVLTVTAGAQESPKDARRKAAEKPRRVILNNDGGEPVVEMKEPTEKAFLDARVRPMAGTHVDAVFYCSRSSG